MMTNFLDDKPTIDVYVQRYVEQKRKVNEIHELDIQLRNQIFVEVDDDKKLRKRWESNLEEWSSASQKCNKARNEMIAAIDKLV